MLFASILGAVASAPTKVFATAKQWWTPRPRFAPGEAFEHILMRMSLAVWTGIYPMKDRINGFRELVGAPQNIVPLALVVIGHPKKDSKPVNRFTEKKVHLKRWSA